MGKPYDQTPGYIPRKDETLKFFLENFANLISQDPAKYGLSEGDSQVISDQSEAFSNALSLVMSGATRTPGLVAQKDAIRASAIGSIRVYAMLIKANQSVSNQDKVNLGLHVDDTTPTPIPAPTSSPLLAIVNGFSGEHQIRYADENTPTLRRKPYGAVSMQLNMHVGPMPIVNPYQATMVGLFTKQPILVPHNPANSTKTATYFSRWVTRTGLFGPWSLPTAMVIAFGGPVDSQMPVTGGGSPASQQTGDGEDELKIAA